jgi:hypothetical protein
MTYKVWCADEGEHSGGAKTYPRAPDADNIDRDWAMDADDAARLYADYCHSNRDGWEWSWPADFMVRDVEANAVHQFSVERETVPEFHAARGVEVKVGPHDHDECPCGHPFGFAEPCVKPPGWGKPCTCGIAPAAAQVDPVGLCPIPVHVADGFPTGQCQRQPRHKGLCDAYDGREEADRLARPWTEADGLVPYGTVLGPIIT